MAADSMGAFGTYKTQYQRYQQRLSDQAKTTQGPTAETVWVTKRYNPLDLRVLAPVPRHKLVAGRLHTPAEQHWVPVTDPPLKSFERRQPGFMFASFPSTRDENWSTLRQMIPSQGSAHKVRPPSWGTDLGPPPYIRERSGLRLPKVNSPMTRYIDDMHATHPLLKLQ